MKSVEQTFAHSLAEYVKFATAKLGLSPPFNIEAGASGVKGAMLYVSESKANDPLGPVPDNFIIWRGKLASTEPVARDEVLLKIFAAIYDSVGFQRPPNMYKFPAKIPGTLPE